MIEKNCISIENMKAKQPIIDISDYPTIELIQSSKDNHFSHKVAKIQHPVTHEIWYRKRSNNYIEAQAEVLARNLLRLFNPSQPETQLAHIHAETGLYYVISKEVQNFRPLPEYASLDEPSGIYPGLGFAMMLSLLFQNTDLKNGNIGLGRSGIQGTDVAIELEEDTSEDEVYIIDGDWFFTNVVKNINQPTNITAELINALPFITGYYTYHWIDIVQKKVDFGTSSLVTRALAENPRFRREVNQIILKYLLTPQAYLYAFVKTFIPQEEDAIKYLNFMNEKHLQLSVAIKKNESFQKYVSTYHANMTARCHLQAMEAYCAIDGRPILEASELDNLRYDFESLTHAVFPKESRVSVVSMYNLSLSASSSLDYSPITPAIDLHEASPEPDIFIELNQQSDENRMSLG